MKKYTLFEYFNKLGISDLDENILPELLAKPILVGLNDETLKSRSIELDLSKKSYWISFVYKIMQKLLDSYLMIGINAVGIAAPQIGISRRLFLADFYTNQIEDISCKTFDCEKIRLCIINPEILEVGADIQISREMCLSLPGFGGIVSRPARVKVRFYDVYFNPYTYVFNGFAAGVFMHEYDHLDGVLYPYKSERLFRYDNSNKTIVGDIDFDYLQNIKNFEFILSPKTLEKNI